VSEHPAAVVGIGVDLISVERVAATVARRPGLLERLFTSAERSLLERGSSADAAERSLAGRFAAKEAVMKALGVGLGEVDFKDIEVVGGRGGRPTIELHGRAETRAKAIGAETVSVSMSHDAGLALAFAVASRGGT
jgi:holo-[acyl-carrier protein] synthase